MPILPREIFNHITNFLDPLQKGNITDTFSFLNKNKSNLLWWAIFKDDIWLSKVISYGTEPMLFSSRLDDVAMAKGEYPVYLLLYTNDFSSETY